MKPSPRKVIADAFEENLRFCLKGDQRWFTDSDAHVLAVHIAAITFPALERAGYEITEIVRYDDWEAKSFREVHNPPGAG